jgi:hypothetical protein
MYESIVTNALRDILAASDRPLSVIEIGTAYGEHLYQLRGCENLEQMVSIDPMYDWVPDLKPDDKFDPSSVNQAKVDGWKRLCGELPISLIIAKSEDAANGEMLTRSDFDVLLIDGCHHPAKAVEDDYWNFTRYLKQSHIVIFDDINHGDPRIAADAVEEKLIQNGSSVSREDVCGGRVRILHVNPQPLIPKT